MQRVFSIDLNGPVGIHLHEDRLWIANENGMAFIEPNACRAEVLLVETPSCWQEMLLDVDVRPILRWIHQFPRRSSVDRGVPDQATQRDQVRPARWPRDEQSAPQWAKDVRGFIEMLGPSDCLLAGSFGDRHFPLLYCLQRSREYENLLRSNPGVGYALLEMSLQETDSPEGLAGKVKTRSTMRGIALAGALGLSAAALSTLGRVRRSALSRTAIVNLLSAISNRDIAEVLADLPVISSPIIEIASDPELWASRSTGLLQDIAEDGSRRETASAAAEMKAVLRMMARLGQSERPKFTSFEKLQEALTWYCLQIPDSTIQEMLTYRFPSPPVPTEDSEVIVPLTTPGELIREGIEQLSQLATPENCQMIADGNLYAYKTTGRWGLERASFTIRRDWHPRKAGEYLWMLNHAEASQGQAVKARTISVLSGFLVRQQHVDD